MMEFRLTLMQRSTSRLFFFLTIFTFICIPLFMFALNGQTYYIIGKSRKDTLREKRFPVAKNGYYGYVKAV